MSNSTLKHLIAFGEFAPDSQEFDSNTLESVFNLIPVFRSYRALPSLERMNPDQTGSITAGHKVSGAYIHRTTEEQGVFVFQPTGDKLIPPELIKVPDDADTFAECIDGLIANDGDYVTFPWTGTQVEAEFTMLAPPTNVDDPSDLRTRMRFRVRGQEGPLSTGSWAMTLTIRDSLNNPIASSSTNGVIGVDATSWATFEYTDFAQAIVNTPWYFELRFDPAPEAGLELYQRVDADVEVTDWGKSDANENHYALISVEDEGAGEDEESYIESKPLLETQNQKARFKIAGAVKDLSRFDNNLLIKHEVLQDDMDLIVNLYDMSEFTDEEIEEPEEILVHTSTITDPKVADGIALRTLALLDSEAEAIPDYRELEIEFDQQGVASGGAVQTLNPTHDSFDGSFVRSDNLNADGLNYAVRDNAVYAKSVSGVGGGTTLDTIIVECQGGVDPQAAAGTYRARCEVKRVGGTSGEVLIQIAGKSTTASVGTGWATVSRVFNYGDIADWNNISVRVNKLDDGGGNGWELQVRRIYVETPGSNNKARIMDFRLETPDSVAFDLAWVQADVDIDPGAGEFYPGDQPKLYMGTETKLLESLVPNYEWTDVTNTGVASDIEFQTPNNYTPYTDEGASPWMFCSFGEDVIATNFWDPIQRKKVLDTEFTDLCEPDSGATPPALDVRGRFVATVGGQLAVANINQGVDDMSSTGRGHTIWVSALGNPALFHAGDIGTQSTYFQLVSRPGQITGMTSGEYSVVFKENAIYRMNYVGLPVIMEFDQVSAEQGTPYPRSIVQADDDVYFWGNGGIFVVTSHGQEVQRIGQNRIEKYLFDTRYEPFALHPDLGSSLRQNWGAVFGAYDPYTGLIIWSYRLQGDAYGENSGLIAYSRKEDRFTALRGYALNYNERFPLPENMGRKFTEPLGANGQDWQLEALVSRGNVVTDEDHLLRGIFAISSSVLPMDI